MKKYKNKYKNTIKSGSGDTKIISNHNKLEELELDIRPKLIISKELKRQIDYLHKQVGSIEWSGAIYYRIINGSMTDLENLELKAEIFYLMDIGTSAYTEYEFNEEIMDFFEKYPEVSEMKMGHMHTHHSMNTFFSGTDMQELHDNAPNYNYYFSLIVNFKEEYCAKMAFVSDYNSKSNSKGDLTFKGSDGNPVKLNLKNVDEDVTKKVLCLIDFDIVIEQEDDELENILKTNSEQVFKNLEDYLKSIESTFELKETIKDNIYNTLINNLDTINLRVDDFTKSRYFIITENKKPKYNSYSSNAYSRNGMQGLYGKTVSVNNSRNNYDEYTDYYEGQYGSSLFDDSSYKGETKNNLGYNSSMRPKRDNILDTKNGIKLTPYEIDNYLSKLLMFDNRVNITIGSALKKFSDDTKGKNLDNTLYLMKDKVFDIYHQIFTVIPDQEDKDQLCIDCITRLEIWEVNFSVVRDIIEMFDEILAKETNNNNFKWESLQKSNK